MPCKAFIQVLKPTGKKQVPDDLDIQVCRLRENRNITVTNRLVTVMNNEM